MNKKQKKMLIRIVIAAVLVVAFSLIPMKGYVKFVLFMIPYLVIGYDILKKAGKGILNRQMSDGGSNNRCDSPWGLQRRRSSYAVLSDR